MHWVPVRPADKDTVIVSIQKLRGKEEGSTARIYESSGN